MEIKYKSNDFFVNPRLEELRDAFHKLVDKIANIVHHLPSLESWVQFKGWRRLGLGEGVTEIDIGKNNYTMFASLPHWYLNEVHQHLNMILQKFFQPLNEYLEKLRLQFGYIFYEINQVRCDAIIPEKEFSFEECVTKVKDFNQLMCMINGMVHNSLSKFCNLQLGHRIV